MRAVVYSLAGMGITLHEGWSILTFTDRPPQAGLLRYERVNALHQWVLDVPACHRHKGFTAIIDPLCVESITPCTDVEAVKFANLPAELREPPER